MAKKNTKDIKKIVGERVKSIRIDKYLTRKNLLNIQVIGTLLR